MTVKRTSQSKLPVPGGKPHDKLDKYPVGQGNSSPVSSEFLSLSGQLVSPRRGVREILQLYSQAPWVRTIVSKIARAVAEVDWALYSKLNQQGKFINTAKRWTSLDTDKRKTVLKDPLQNFQNIENHPLLDLFVTGTGNPRLNGFGVFQVTQTHLDLAGEAYWLIERDPALGIPKALWPMPPSWVRALPTEANPFYELNMPSWAYVKVPVTEIVPFIDPDPNNPYGRGSGLSLALDDEIQTDEYAAKHMKAFFLNRARPDLIISGQFISEKDSLRLEKQWLSSHQGFWKAFKPLFFSQKIDVKELTQSFESMQMVQVRKHERDTFVQVFGVPPEKFGIMADSKRSTIAQADLFWQKDVIRPRLEAIRRSIQGVLVPQYDDRLILDYETPVIQDDVFRLDVMKVQPAAFTVNDFRREANKPSLGPPGDVLIVPLNSQLIPVVTPDGGPIEITELVENSVRGLRTRAGQPDVLDGRDIANRISSDVVEALEDSLSDVKSLIRKKA